MDKKVKEHRDLLSEAASIFPGGCPGAYAVPSWVNAIISHGEGSRLYAKDGRVFLDYILGNGPLILGHCHPMVVSAVQDQATRGSHFYSLHEPVIRLGRIIADVVPCADLVFFSSSGAEATLLALRLARAFTKRELILKFEGSYHGHHDYSSTNSAGVPRGVAETVIVVPHNNLELLERTLDLYSGKIAAVLVEPVHRVTPPATGFLEGLRRATQRSGSVLIFDEVVSGFRLALGGGQERFGVTPDLACFGKALGGGYPISAVAGKNEIMELVNPQRAGSADYVFFSGTLSANPICTSAGLATLGELAKPGVYRRLDEAGEKLREAFNDAASEFELPARMIGIGAINGVVSKDGNMLSGAEGDKLLKKLGSALYRRGILCNPAKVYVSLAHSNEDLTTTMECYRDAIAEVQAG